MILFGIPLLIGLAVLVIIAITVRLIIKAYTKNQGEPNYRTGPTDGRDKPYATDKSGWTRKDV